MGKKTIYSQDIDGQFLCPYYDQCEKQFKHQNIGSITVHVHKEHQDLQMLKKQDYKYGCSCNKRYKRKRDLISHQSHKGHSSAQCKIFDGLLSNMGAWIELYNNIEKMNPENLIEMILCDMTQCTTNMTEEQLLSMPVELIQKQGFFILIPLPGRRQIFEIFLAGRGYQITKNFNKLFQIDDSQTIYEYIQTYYSRQNKECIIGFKGDLNYLRQNFKGQKSKNYYFKHENQSEQICEIIEKFKPIGQLLNIFGPFHYEMDRWIFLSDQKIQNYQNYQSQSIQQIQQTFKAPPTYFDFFFDQIISPDQLSNQNPLSLRFE
ncbi:hypothetical protein OXYTRIMIC_025 [Oxytricha trifallax]|uniref:Uncharacterized protein n=1 Tax=Oxytricha trifallax TaxID=1172189 RepID=A0A073HZF9_9SPIT|nr:hypothetical protein OXYTRIMIC_025 [Oxytricha trifallax]